MDKLRLSRPNLGDEEIQAVAAVLRSGDLVYGKEGCLLENEFKEYLGCRHAVLVSSGTAALHLSLLAHGIGKGDAVIVPGFTFPATLNVVMMTGAIPIVVDVNLEAYCIEPALVEEAIIRWRNPETIKAIIPVHEFGHPADMAKLRSIASKFNLLIVEDAACAIGGSYNASKIGNGENTACFSFHPRKVLTTGEGGLVATNDDALAERIRGLRNHGLTVCDGRREYLFPGLNYRMTDIQSAIGRIQLKKLDAALAARRILRGHYDRYFQNSPLIRLPSDDPGHTWQAYMVVLDKSINRNAIISMLVEQGIESGIGATALSRIRYGTASPLPISEILFEQGLALPFCETMEERDCARVAEALLCALATISRA